MSKKELVLDLSVSLSLKNISTNKQLNNSKFKVMTNEHYRNLAFEMTFGEAVEKGKLGNQKILAAIKNADKYQKRMFLLGMLDRDKMAFIDLKKELMKVQNNESIETVNQKKDIVNLIRKYIEVGDIEKKAFGEVTTPVKLVNEMLDTLPSEVWTNPNLKWLDPATGAGIFQAVVIERLMKGLSEFEPSEDLRYKHIVENMIYMCELQHKNVFIYLCAFDVFDKYDLNVYCGSYLDSGFDNHMRNEWRVDKFDIILGNPPYNDDSGNKGKGHTLWTQFVQKSINILQTNGYLVYVHPSLWRNVNHEILNLLKRFQIEYLEMHNEQDGIRVFNASTRYDFYCLNKCKPHKETIIKDENGDVCNININEWSFIPNSMFNEIKSLIDSKDKCVVLHSESAYEPRREWMNAEETNEFKYPCIYSINKANKLKLKYSSTNRNGHFNISKVAWGSGATGFIIDEKGEYALTQWCSAIVDKPENLNNIFIALQSDKFNNIIKAAAVSKAEINYKIIQEFKKDFYKEFI